MNKTGGILGIIGSLLGFLASIVTVFVGGIGKAFNANGSILLTQMGWIGLIACFLAIIAAAMCFSKPRGAGIILIVLSILGMLGGLLVGIFMLLTLAGGIVTVMSAPKVQPSVNTEEVPIRKKFAWTKMKIGIAVIFSLFLVLILVGRNHTQKPSEQELNELATSEPSRLTPIAGFLANAINDPERRILLGQEGEIDRIKGRVVAWNLPIYSVTDMGSVFRVQTKSTTNSALLPEVIPTFVYISPRSEEEKEKISSLKEGMVVHFKGKIDGKTVEWLNIKPAILWEPKNEVSAPVPVGISKPQAEQSIAEIKQQDQGTLKEVVGRLQYGKLDSVITVEGSADDYTFVSDTPDGTKLLQVCGTDHCLVKGYFTNGNQLQKLVDVKKIPLAEQASLKENLSTAQIPQNASFDCKKAKSASEILICGDPELSRLDSELANIYRQAKSNSLDAGEFKDQTTAAWKWREANCRDKACLLAWYARRKDALLKVGLPQP